MTSAEAQLEAIVRALRSPRLGAPCGSADALERFVSPLFAVGVRLERDGGLSVVAPFGLDDLFAMRLRPNPRRPTRGLARSAASAMARWPEQTVAD